MAELELQSAPNKNAGGILGPICNNCAGFGYTLGLKGESAGGGCYHCNQTGVRTPSNQELNTEIIRLQKLLVEAGISPTTRVLKSIKASRQFWVEMLAWATATATAVANSTTETVLFPNITIPANYMQDGRQLQLNALGSYGTTSTPTLIVSLRWGGVTGTVIGKSTTITTTSGTGGGASMTALWNAQLFIQTRSNGSGGTLMSNGTGTLFTSANPTAGTVTNYGLPFAVASGSTGGTTPVAVTADLTADTPLSLTATWGTANAANSIQGTNYSLESMN